MNRRAFLVVGSTAITVPVAGCTSSADTPDEEDFQTVAEWMADTMEYLSESLSTISDWLEDQESVDVATFSDMGDGANQLLDDYSESIEPFEDEISGWEVPIDQDGESWTVEGERLYDAVDDLWWGLSDASILFMKLEDADGNPSELTPVFRDDLELFFDETPGAIEEARWLLYRN